MKIFGDGNSSEVLAPSSSLEWSLDGMISKGDYGNLFLSDFTIREQEIIDVRKCFDDVSHIYAFGRNPEGTVMSTSFLVMLNPRCTYTEGQLELNTLRQIYDANRIYKKRDTVHVSIGTENMNGYLVGMHIGVSDPRSQLVTVTFNFLLDEVS